MPSRLAALAHTIVDGPSRIALSFGVHIHRELHKRYTPAEINGHQVIDSTWAGIINKL
jgi:hypothetical protein